MRNSGLMLLLTACSFSVYLIDVVAGAYFRAASLSDVAAVVMLALASVFFTIAIVELERRAVADAAIDNTAEPLE